MARVTAGLYGHPLSCHAHRVQLFLSLLRLPHEVVEVDLLRGEHKRPEFLAMNPLGQLPVGCSPTRRRPARPWCRGCGVRAAAGVYGDVERDGECGAVNPVAWTKKRRSSRSRELWKKPVDEA